MPVHTKREVLVNLAVISRYRILLVLKELIDTTTFYIPHGCFFILVYHSVISFMVRFSPSTNVTLGKKLVFSDYIKGA